MVSAKRLSKKLFTALFAALWLAGLCVFPATLSAAGTNINVNVCPPIPYPPPTITTPSDGTKTKESSVLMSGEATPEVTVYAYRNGVQVGYVTAGGDGIFTISVSLDVGMNELIASTNNGCSGPTFSDPVNVDRKVVKPPQSPNTGNGSGPAATPDEPASLQPDGAPITDSRPDEKKPSAGQPPESLSRPVILEPRHGTKVNDPHILVVGEASANTNVRVLRNDLVMAEVLSDEDGRFTVGITLAHGENRLVASIGQGIDALHSEPVTVTYEPAPIGITDRRTLLPLALTVMGGLMGGSLAYLMYRRMHHPRHPPTRLRPV